MNDQSVPSTDTILKPVHSFSKCFAGVTKIISLQAQPSLVLTRATSAILTVGSEISLAALGPDCSTSVSPKKACAHKSADFIFFSTLYSPNFHNWDSPAVCNLVLYFLSENKLLWVHVSGFWPLFLIRPYSKSLYSTPTFTPISPAQIRIPPRMG